MTSLKNGGVISGKDAVKLRLDLEFGNCRLSHIENNDEPRVNVTINLDAWTDEKMEELARRIKEIKVMK